MQAERSHLPLKINTSGRDPADLRLVAAADAADRSPSSPAIAVEGESTWGDVLITITTALQQGAPLYMSLTAAGIIFSASSTRPSCSIPRDRRQSEALSAASVPGIRPGKRTEEYLDYVLTRITVVGAAYLTVICLVPEFLIARAGIPFYLGGTSLLIVVNVTMDTVTQIQSHLIAHQYGDLIKKAKLKGGRAR
jgi:preprotein translocase subunit SecY